MTLKYSSYACNFKFILPTVCCFPKATRCRWAWVRRPFHRFFNAHQFYFIVLGLSWTVLTCMTLLFFLWKLSHLGRSLCICLRNIIVFFTHDMKESTVSFPPHFLHCQTPIIIFFRKYACLLLCLFGSVPSLQNGHWDKLYPVFTFLGCYLFHFHLQITVFSSCPFPVCFQSSNGVRSAEEDTLALMTSAFCHL